jgi:hypothetical protein
MFSGGGNGPKSDVPLLRPGDLFEKRKQRDGARLKAYNTILEQIYTRIRSVSRSGADPWIVYTIPPVIMGMPKIDLEDCVVYLVYMMRQQQYEVRYTYPNLLYISWKHHERNYILNSSPIMQTMLATQSSKPKNELRQGGASRVRFQEQVQSHSFNPSAPLSSAQQRAPGRAPPRNTTEYKPPTTFLNALEQPVAEPRADVLKDFLSF